MENTNIAAINAMNRPVVTAKDIAEKLGIGKSTVQGCLNNKFAKGYRKETVDKVRKAAEEMGYDKQASIVYGYMLSGETRRKIKEPKNYRGGNFLTKEAEVQRMKELRAEGYTNFQIARKIGRSFGMVFHCIGKQDPSLTAISHKLRGQRTRMANAARKQYLHNKPIAEYNAKVDQANELKEAAAKALAAAEALHAELSKQQPAIEKLAAQKIPVPQIDLGSLQPTALQ